MPGFMAEKRESSAFLSLAFRPFFLAASLWSALALVLWIAMLMAGMTLPSRFDPLTWHIHEMLFGFVLAAIAGFMLTAIPNWTGRLPVRGAPLAWLAALWLLGRVACLVSALIPYWFAAVADLSFPVILAAAAGREIAAGRNWRNLPMILPVAVLSIADLLMHLEAGGFGVPSGLGWRLGLAAIVVLISVVGGRIIPSFTSNWLAKHGTARLPALPRWVDRCALGSLHAGLVGWAFFPGFRPLGMLLLLAAALNLLRLARWRGGATLAEPLLAVLHLGYLWVIAGAALLGAAMLSEIVPGPAAIHALTAGAIGTMVLAVMTRVSLGHTGRALEADRATMLIYLLVNAAAAARIGAAFVTGNPMILLAISGALWVAGFALFGAKYWPMLWSGSLRQRRTS
ncbi:MAG TPA: NnrS family protein [Methylocella sp.]|nr:NnrS family protein [Methylocella sp.]